MTSAESEEEIAYELSSGVFRDDPASLRERMIDLTVRSFPGCSADEIIGMADLFASYITSGKMETP